MITTIVILTFLLISIICYCIYRSKVFDGAKMIAIPVCLMLATTLGVYYKSQLGKPIKSMPPAEWVYIHHVANSERIELWVKVGGESRVYCFPFTDEAQKKLAEAAEASQNGQAVEGKELDVPQGTEHTPGKFDFDIRIIDRSYTK